MCVSLLSNCNSPTVSSCNNDQFMIQKYALPTGFPSSKSTVYLPMKKLSWDTVDKTVFDSLEILVFFLKCCVCMCVCAHVHACVHACVCVCVCIHHSVCVFLHVNTCLCVHLSLSFSFKPLSMNWPSQRLEQPEWWGHRTEQTQAGRTLTSLHHLQLEIGTV